MTMAEKPKLNERQSQSQSQSERREASPVAAKEAPWWRHPMVWLVISGPVLVVVAGFWTLWLAIQHPDPIVPDHRAHGVRADDAHAPAQVARNHAATSRARP